MSRTDWTSYAIPQDSWLATSSQAASVKDGIGEERADTVCRGSQKSHETSAGGEVTAMTAANVAIVVSVIMVVVGFVASQRFASTNGVAPSRVASPPPIVAPVPSPGFTGTWEAADPGTLPTRIVIQHVDAYSARILYTWGDGSLEGTWLNARAKVLSDGKLYWRFPGAFTLTLSPDGQMLIGERESGGWKASATFRRVSKI
jgi:hypothetical protein